MLDAFIIEEIKRRHPEQHREERPSIELPVPEPPARSPNRSNDDREGPGGDRGVVIIDYSA
ncbi:hypothetical protein [Anaeromyxobacter paludicola]|uniref:Uncharacterized protein n=1 Tax=Anaeromyxobacter paludicola TaxID=2918171 RepID=A0ABN6N723_9BACT|nr:hypothetical protein [Anaeromyxobacter paludicola]BDG07717.1 hypothetical protein AMPC_08300 [Anaeromyxobacter paludicola]